MSSLAMVEHKNMLSAEDAKFFNANVKLEKGSLIVLDQYLNKKKIDKNKDSKINFNVTFNCQETKKDLKCKPIRFEHLIMIQPELTETEKKLLR